MSVDWTHILLFLMFVGVWALIAQLSLPGSKSSMVANSTLKVRRKK